MFYFSIENRKSPCHYRWSNNLIDFIRGISYKKCIRITRTLRHVAITYAEFFFPFIFISDPFRVRYRNFGHKIAQISFFFVFSTDHLFSCSSCWLAQSFERYPALLSDYRAAQTRASTSAVIRGVLTTPRGTYVQPSCPFNDTRIVEHTWTLLTLWKNCPAENRTNKQALYLYNI